MTQLEKVARAIKDTGLLEYSDQDTCLALARAALTTLMDVDEGAVEAMVKGAPVTWPFDWEADSIDRGEALKDGFQAAISHILAGGAE